MARRAGAGLDWLNFFTANLQTAFGPFVSVYLTAAHWTQSEIGFALGVGYVATVASQVPAGALVDAIAHKRAAAAAAIVAIVAGALLLAAFPAMLPVALAEILHGFASCMLNPAIAAITLGLAAGAVGERLGRNARFASVGNGLAAGLMGVVGSTAGPRAVFLLGAALALPGLWALRLIPPPRGAGAGGAGSGAPAPLGRLLRDRRLLLFLACCAGFHLANAAMLPLAAAEATKRIGNAAELVIAACIVVPQAVVALLSPAVGRWAERVGRRKLMVVGFAALPVRGVLLALMPPPALLIPIQALDGVGGAVFGVLLPLVASDLTRDTGRFNLCMGVVGLGIGAAAAASTWAGGAIADRSLPVAFLALAGVGAAATALVALAMPETRPEAAKAKGG